MNDTTPTARPVETNGMKSQTICPQCGKPMLLHFAKKPFRPIIACAECKTYVNEAGQIKTSVG